MAKELEHPIHLHEKIMDRIEKKVDKLTEIVHKHTVVLENGINEKVKTHSRILWTLLVLMLGMTGFMIRLVITG
jgi:uncharacterized protein YcaQ